MNDELDAWLRLGAAWLRGPALEPLLEAFGDASAIVSQSDAELARFGIGEIARNALKQPDRDAIDAALAWAEEADNRLVHAGSDDYPAMLKQIRDWPPLLFVKGDVDALHLPTLAIVGSRNPTRGGRDNAFAFARHLGRSGFVIASGLAQGIDTAAHRGALEGSAKTVAVLGHGIDRVYPAANRELAHAIAAQGALVSEYPLGTAPRAEHFPARNRLISGLAVGTLVVEAAYRSGSLITARLASEQGREVFAIPGSIHNALARGCHRLIRDGAKLVESAADIVDELEPLVGQMMRHNDDFGEPEPVSRGTVERDPDYDKLLDAMGFEAVTPDEIAANCGLTIGQVSSMLLILELEGDVEVLQGGRYSRLSRG